MKKVFVIFVVSLFGLSGCTHYVPEKPMTQLQIREMQSREFDTKDLKLVTKSVMNVLQDEGFIIKNAVSDLGLINAERYNDIENPNEVYRAQFFAGPQARWNKQLITEASANITEHGSRTRVRLNVQIKKIDNYGCPADVKTVLNPEFYQIFFEKVGKGIFIQQENI